MHANFLYNHRVTNTVSFVSLVCKHIVTPLLLKMMTMTLWDKSFQKNSAGMRTGTQPCRNFKLYFQFQEMDDFMLLSSSSTSFYHQLVVFLLHLMDVWILVISAETVLGYRTDESQMVSGFVVLDWFVLMSSWIELYSDALVISSIISY